MMVNNVRGVKSKENVIKRIIEEESPIIVGLVETKLKEEDVVNIKGYNIERADRDEEGGGVLIAYKESLQNIVILVREYKKHNCEMLWLKINNKKLNARIGLIYMPQESRTSIETLKEIYRVIEEEVQKSIEMNEKIVVMGDLNCKIGEIIKGNSVVVTKGGKLLLKIINKYKLKIVNAEKCCQGLWTRREGENESILDYIIVNEENIEVIENMIIDTNQMITPYSIEISNGTKVRKYSDHFTITCTINWTMEKETTKHVKRLSSKKYGEFREELERKKVSEIIDQRNICESYTEWNNKVVEIRDKYSMKKKVQRKWKVNRQLTKAKNKIKKELKFTKDKNKKRELKKRKELIQDYIDQELIKKECAKVNEIITKVKKSGGVNSSTFWEVRKQLTHKKTESGHAI